MPFGQFNEESIFFVQVKSLVRGAAITCGRETTVQSAAQLMQRHDITGLVVLVDDVPKGVFSVRDLRRIVADGTLDPQIERVGDHMSSSLVTLGHSAYVFEAVFKMAKHGIHRLALLDGDGKLCGVITDNDLLRAKTRTPIYLNQEIEAAQSIEELGGLSARLLEAIRFATRAGADARSLVQLISHFNDCFTLRIIALLEEKEGISLPEGAAYVVLGSEGRKEQTLRTDQDSAIVYCDDLPQSAQEPMARFADRLVDALEQVGVPRCPGNTMASNPQWRHSLTEWKRIVEEWIDTPKPENMVNFGMFQDIRTLHGDPSLERDLRQHIVQTVQSCMLFLPHMARHIVRFTPPIGMFGNIKVERRGEHRGKVDLKKGGIFALNVGVSLLALEGNIVGGSTWDKLDELAERKMLSSADLSAIEESFTFLVALRLKRQLRSINEGNPPGNHVDPLVITDRERQQLRSALRGVSLLLKLLTERYRLNSIAR